VVGGEGSGKKKIVISVPGENYYFVAAGWVEELYGRAE